MHEELAEAATYPIFTQTLFRTQESKGVFVCHFNISNHVLITYAFPQLQLLTEAEE